MGNLVPQLRTCAPPLEVIDPFVRFRQSSFCCGVSFHDHVEDDNALNYLETLKTVVCCPCDRCSENIPLAVQLVKTRYEEECRQFDALNWTSSPAKRLNRVLSGGWGLKFDRKWNTDVTLSFCEWLEARMHHDPSVDSWSWSAVLWFIEEDLDASNSSSAVLRSLWHERWEARVRCRHSLELAGCCLLRAGFPRELRLIIYRLVGGSQGIWWRSWSTRLPALKILWESRVQAKKMAEDARFAIEVALRVRCLAVDPEDGWDTYEDIMDIVQENTQLYSRSAWLHWVSQVQQRK